MGAFRWCRRTKNFLYPEMRFSPLNLPRFDHFWNWKKELHHRSPDPEKAKRNIGLRCCSANDTMCTSWSNNFWALLDRGCSNNGRAIRGKPMTYSEAEAFCKAMNQDLCSEDMLSKEMTRDERKCKRTKFGGYWVRACPGGCRFSGCWHENRNMYAKDLE